ncbi:uncharacterized protein LOC136088783 isoform X2 [Hydra vulgaris]|uniref:Uncharacterized protein LOC136088783 isoform X2 n=1 Tax=Hydra vulgaris TaxID=6087 RepID=A0ABM4D5K5_HYDVU
MRIHYSSFAILIFYYNLLTLGSCTSSTIISCSSATTVPPAQPSAELIYEAYRIYRTQHPGPTSNRSYLRWIWFGGKDDLLFRWPYYPPNRSAGDSSRDLNISLTLVEQLLVCIRNYGSKK